MSIDTIQQPKYPDTLGDDRFKAKTDANFVLSHSKFGQYYLISVTVQMYQMEKIDVYENRVKTKYDYNDKDDNQVEIVY